MFHLNLENGAAIIRNHCVEEFGPLHGKEKEFQRLFLQSIEAVLRKPDRIRKTDHHGFIRRDEGQRTEDGVAEPRRAAAERQTRH